MRKSARQTLTFLAMPICIFLSACASSPHASYPLESFTSTNVFSSTFPGTNQIACEGARRALLSQGYIISKADATEVIGEKKFQMESDVHTQIEFHVACAEDNKGSNSTTVFANAVRDRYTLKKSNDSASLGVGVLGSVSLPIRMSDDSLVKVASETIPSKDFYDGFFTLMTRYIDTPADLTRPSPIDASTSIKPEATTASAPK
jgi:hypothetical protein